MDETPEQKFNRISHAVQESILRNYPNPERKGCPGDEVVRQVAARTELKADELGNTLPIVLPGTRYFWISKQEFRRRRAIRRRTAIGLIAAAAAAIPVVVITRLHSPVYDRQIGDWDLEASTSARGAGTDEQNVASPQLDTRSRGYIRVHLPVGSEAGEYHLQIRNSENGSALQVSTGTAAIVNGHTLVSFPVDFAGLSAGPYFAAISGASRVWRVYPLQIG